MMISGEKQEDEGCVFRAGYELATDFSGSQSISLGDK